MANGLYSRCDVLVRGQDGWEIIEVKSSTKIKDEHIEDLAFQVFVLRQAGLVVTAAKLCRVNSSNALGDNVPFPIPPRLTDTSSASNLPELTDNVPFPIPPR